MTRPSVMLIDIDLPQVTGLDIVRRLRTNPDLDQMHIFVMTAHQSESILKEARSLSIDDVITKPIDTQALVYRIRALL
ncbi:response regulator [Hydrogenophaga sp.]|uniref:response regulator n=1 Tax=Hydrogenophaga sp. TaxID=1904254 RepID=UPI00257A227B|nr:response regulator [Hydrogenophaga sp.]